MTRTLCLLSLSLLAGAWGCDDSQGEAAPPAEQQGGLLEGGADPASPVRPVDPVAPTDPEAPADPEADPTAGRWEVVDSPEVRRARALASLEARQAERRRLFDLGGARTSAADAELIATASQPGPASARVLALKALAGQKRPEHLAALVSIITSDAPFEVRVEAAVTLSLWGEVARAMPHLKEFGRLGAQVRRAFLIEGEGGALALRPEARDYFRTALASPASEVRVDAAVGLLEFGQVEAALPLLERQALEAERPDERLYAVVRLAQHRALAPARTLLARASRDEDPAVATAARRALAGEVSP